MKKLLLLSLFLIFSFSRFVFAEESVLICYGYGCYFQTQIIYSQKHLNEIEEILQSAQTAEEEREKIGEAIGFALKIAGEQSPIHQDLAGNFNDPPSGKMDCIDHSQSTHRLLQLFEKKGFLKWHAVFPIQTRYWLFIPSHHSAAVVEMGNHQVFVVDSWFVDNGKNAVILPLQLWKKGGGPDV